MTFGFKESGNSMSNAITCRVRLLGLPGSLRKDSFSLAVLRGLQAACPANIEVVIQDIDLPLYNQDTDGGASPGSVERFRDAIAQCDGLIIVTPEYNHSIPGVLKNAIDWASRPLGASVLNDKRALVMSVSPAFTGGVRAQSHLHETLLACEVRPMGGPQVVIGNVVEKVGEGRLVDQAALDFALSAVQRLAALCAADLEPSFPTPVLI